LLAVNETHNLTAIREYDEAWTRHIEDSLALLNVADFRDKRVLDVGSGAGLPGMVLRIAEPSVRLTLLDATAKKAEFLRGAAELLGLDNVTCVHARAEEYAHGPDRESFDIVTARGVAALPALCELCLPFVKTGGLFLAMKRDDAETAPAHLWGGRRREGVWYELSGGLRHYIAVFEKISLTPEEYPRPWAQIRKSAKTE
jgi:16S rRNA (guanine527-N7)-methyltransferase